MQMHHTKTAILSMFLFLQQKNRRTYCWPTRAKIQWILKNIHKISVTLATIDKHLKDLNENGYIVSYRQFGQREDGTWFLKPSNRQLTKKSILLFKRLGVSISAWLYKHFFKLVDVTTPFNIKREVPALDPEKVLRRPRFSEFSTIGELVKPILG